MLHVGVDAWNLPGDHRGIGRYVRSILREWERSFAQRVRVTLIVPEWHTWTVRGRYRAEAGGAPYPVVSRALHGRAKLDVLWFPWNGVSWLDFAEPAVATLHDATVFAIPGYAPQTRVIFHNAAARCRALITDSVFSARELARELALPPERLTPILLGVDMPPPLALPPPVAGEQPYVLFVGTAEQRKGIATLVRAMERVQRFDPALRLVIAGSRGDGLNGSERIAMRALGFVDDAALDALYRGASLFAFPSRYEGFGLPVLEAMSYGVPVITTNVTAIPEAGGDAALYVPLDDDVALAEAIARVRSDPALAASLRERGRAHAASMTWTKTAAATLGVLERAAS
ncbi:MAG TPA: glycosyltransferase family 1 protein [Candidatus Acidoferrales bacterium]|nr:glycosyltransferase family 1 protein [Candidatus Acidoferrales bacterium]